MHPSRGLWLGLVQASLLSFLPACSDNPEEAASACNSLVNDGREVRYVDALSAAPTPMGGTILDGMYELTEINLYDVTPGPPDSIARAIFQISGTTMQQVGEIDGQEQRYSSTFTTSGALLTIDDTCPKPNRDQPAFTATSTDLRFFIVSGGGTLEMVLTKR